MTRPSAGARAAAAGVACALGALMAACAPNTGPAGPAAPGERCTTLGPEDPFVAEQRTIFLGGDGSYPIYRIPSVVTTGSGVVLTFTEARPSTADPGSGRIDVVVRRSDDCGRSWSPLTVVGDAGDDDAHNPTAVVVPLADGGERVMLFYGQRPRSAGGEFDLPAGFGPGAATMWMRTSDDDGATWTAPRDVTAQVKDPTWRVASFGPGRAIVTRWGTPSAPPHRIVVPGWFSSDARGTGSFVAWSDDEGRSWHGSSTPAGVATDESQVVETTDGSLLLDTRAEGFRRVYRSVDGGATWGSPTAGLTMPPVMSSVSRDRAVRDGDAFDRLLHTSIARDGRFDLRVLSSRDEGVTWDRSRLLVPGIAQYSVLTPLPDGTVGVVYESTCVCDDGHGPLFGWAIRFLRFDPDRLDPDGA